jgi:Ssp1 endopeptidase immunity protein Rap1a
MISREDFVPRATICAVVMMLIPASASAQQARSDGAYLYEGCIVLASEPEDFSRALNPKQFSKAMFCLGYVHAIHAALVRIHERYYKSFPNYGNWKDETFVGGWFAEQISLAPDVCFPNKVVPKTLAMIIVKYGKEHPEDLTKDMFVFAGFAFQSTYPPSRSDACIR